MKSAEEVATEIISGLCTNQFIARAWEDSFPDTRKHYQDSISQALTAFANERVKESSSVCDHSGPCDDCIDKFKGQGRAEARKECDEEWARRLAEKPADWVIRDLAHKIRALKEAK